MANPKLFIVGAGQVGATAAYASMLKKVVNEIIITDIAEELLNAVVMDQMHASMFSKDVVVRRGSYDELEDGDIVVVTAGAPTKGDQSRLELVNINVKILKSILEGVMKPGKNIFLILVSNPVDVLTYVALKETGLNKERVFGSGTTLDSMRMHAVVSDRYGVSGDKVSGFVLGEHGDSSFIAESTVVVDGKPLSEMGMDENGLSEMEDKVRTAAYEIIKGKGATNFGIGAVVSELVGHIVRGDEIVTPLSLIAEGEYGLEGLAIGLPGKLSSEGVVIDTGLVLNDREKQKLQTSSEIIKDIIKQAGY